MFQGAARCKEYLSFVPFATYECYFICRLVTRLCCSYLEAHVYPTFDTSICLVVSISPTRRWVPWRCKAPSFNFMWVCVYIYQLLLTVCLISVQSCAVGGQSVGVCWPIRRGDYGVDWKMWSHSNLNLAGRMCVSDGPIDEKDFPVLFCCVAKVSFWVSE